jgi:DNA-binding transcriptional ArsR family regulator
MPAPALTIAKPQTGIVEVNIEPVHNALHSLMSILKAAHLSGLGEWVESTRAALTPDELETHRLVMEGLHYALYPQRQWSTFSAFIEHLQNMDPAALRMRLLDGYFTLPWMRDEPSPYQTFEEVLQSPESYIDFLTGRFGEEVVDPRLEKQAYALVVDPPAMQALIVSHLSMMWDRFLAVEWARVEPMLADSAAAFEATNLSRMSYGEAAEFITGQALPEKHLEIIERDFNRLVFVPSAHVGPYLGHFYRNDTYYIIFGARLPQGAALDAPDLSRNEIVVRLNALADDTRLRILHFIAQNGEQCSQDIINELDLSQSAASRHLKQLSATGYLIERRHEGAKCYSLGEDRLRDTFQAILAFLAVSP